MAHDIEVRPVAPELEIFSRRVGAQRLVRLSVRVAPEVHQRGVARHYAERIGAAKFAAGFIEHADRHLTPLRG